MVPGIILRGWNFESLDYLFLCYQFLSTDYLTPVALFYHGIDGFWLVFDESLVFILYA